MPVEAHINRTWAAKWLIMATALLIFGALCVKDAVWTYPTQQERYAEYERFMEAGDNDGWLAYAEQQGWPPDEPENYSDLSIMTQWLMLAVAAPLGFAALGLVLYFRGRKLVATEEGLISHRGEFVPYDAVTAIDKERWDSKGIAFVEWEQDGESGRVKIDDWVFRDAWRVLDQVEDQTGLGEPVPS